MVRATPAPPGPYPRRSARRLASTWLQEADRLNAHDDFALLGRDLSELIAGLDRDSVQGRGRPDVD